MSESNGPTVIDYETGEPVNAGCAKHSDHWLAKAVRQNRVLLNLPPQECECQPTPTPAGSDAGGGQ